MPFNSANSKVCPFNTHITPLVAFSPVPSFVKNILYCVLSGITIESNKDALDKFSSNKLCTLELIVPNSTSPILAVPAIVRNPSGPKNIKSPANSWIVSPLIHPISLVTAVIAKSDT